MLCFFLADFGVIFNRQSGKFLAQEHLALEEVTDSQMDGDNTPCILFGSFIWAQGL